MTYTAADLPPRLTKLDGSPDMRGLLTFTEPLPDELQRLEDATAHWDLYSRPRNRRRSPTETERVLLRAIGLTLPDDDPNYQGVPLRTFVNYAGNTTRIRRWPLLADQTPISGVHA